MNRIAVLFFVLPVLVQAQTSDTTARTAADSVILRARKLGSDGREAEGRRLIDSLLKVTPPEGNLYAEALYARASLATTAADAERDYRRLLIEAPLAARAEDALLQLAQLLQARGDRRGASDHLQRFMLSYGNSPARPRVALALVRLLFDQGPQQQARACEALRMGREAIPSENLELRNQLEFYAPRCAMMVVEAPPPADSTAATTPPPTSPSPDTTHRRTPSAEPSPRSAGAPTASSYYSVQIAAYNSREPAANLASVLKERGIEARVDGTSAPFRVRVGKYTTRADAVKAAATLKSQGHNGFITLVQGSK
ncbi:MAG: SPOR domain-containing protein [Gemmatimonadaceae bacterium]